MKKPPRESDQNSRLEPGILIGFGLVVIIGAVLANSLRAPSSSAAPTDRLAAGSAGSALPATQPPVELPTFPPGYPTDKAADNQRAAEEMATARAHAASKSSPPPPPPAPASAPTFQSGIFDGNDGGIPASTFQVRNRWAGPINGQWLLVYAGAVGSATGQPGPGAVRIYKLSITPTNDVHSDFVGVFPMPASSGALKIVAVSGDVMQLQTQGGEAVFFNLATHQYQ